MGEHKMPLFIALLVPDERLTIVAKLFEKYGFKPVKTDELHLTILFIGDYSGVHAHRIASALAHEKVVMPDTLYCKEVTLLPPGKNTHVAVIVEKDNRLANAREKFARVIERLGYSIRDRYFNHYKPHITIARRRRGESLPPQQLLARANTLLPRSLHPTHLALLETTPKGYRILAKLEAKWD